jgi:hypothetical protein
VGAPYIGGDSTKSEEDPVIKSLPFLSLFSNLDHTIRMKIAYGPYGDESAA